MKKIFLLLLFISTIAQAQIVNIPDANFKAKLLSANMSNQIAYGAGGYLKIDANEDGQIQISEAIVVDSLNIEASNIVDLTGIESFNNLKKIKCENNQISNLSLLSNTQLRELYFDYNPILSFNITGLSLLEKISCQSSFLLSTITNLDLSMFINLQYVNCSYNLLTNINLDNLSNLKFLQCRDNLLTNLNVNGLFSIEELDCQFNQIANLNCNNLLNLKTLSCSDNQINNLTLDNLSALEYLSCGNNQLLSIDVSDCLNLINFNVDGNLLTNVDLFQNVNLTNFSCSQNQLISLNVSNNVNLVSINCTDNPIAFIDCSNTYNLYNLTAINCLNLSHIYIKNARSTWLEIGGCDNLDFVCCDVEYISGYTDQLYWLGLSNVNINSYCSFTPGGDYNTITGTIIYDQANDGCDAFDLTQNYIRVDINDGTNTGASFTNATGNYSFYTQAGNFTLTPNIENPTWFNFSPISATIPFADNNNNIATQNFCITANGVHPDLEIVIAPIVPARPGFTAEYQIVYRNKGNQVMSQLYGVNFFYNQNLMAFVSATQVPSSIVSGGMSWDFANLMPFESRSINVIMQINAPTDTNPVNIGDVLQFTSSIMPMAGDESTVDNLFQLNQTVVGSYDPNDITCIEGDVVAPSYIGDFLHYVINFENTGTAPAENVVVKIEVNPSDFDINSLRILEASHNATIKITNNILEIIFQTIMLDTGGHGNVLLKVKSKENLVTNDNVTKNAKIYFDYNFPILTNDANTTFQVLSNSIPTKDLAISLYPNPTSSLINIKAENVVKSIEIYDVQGRVIQVNKTDSKEVVLDVSTYNSGIYFVKVSTDFGSHIEKIVKD